MDFLLNLVNSVFGRNRESPVETIVRFIDRNGRPDQRYLAACLNLGLRSRAERIARLIPQQVSVDSRIRLALFRGNFNAALNLAKQSLGTSRLSLCPKKTEHEIIGLMAPVSPREMLSISCTSRWTAPCAPALALATGELTLYRQLESRMSQHLGPDKWLLSANYEKTISAKLQSLNEYLRTFGLSGLAVITSGVTLGVNNITPINLGLPSWKDGPLLSVVMTAFNCDRYIESSIRSVLGQSYKNVELIIVDDSSNDTTWERISTLSITDTRIKAIRLAKNVGTYAAKNVGLELARGQYVAFQDADDWSHPERFSRCISTLSANENLVAVSAMYVRLDDYGYFLSSKIWPLTRWTPNSIVFRRREVLEKIGYFETVRFGADSEYMARVRAFFGEHKHRKLRIPLLIAAHRKGSLMTAEGTGLSAGGYSEERMQYQEEWSERLIQNVLNRQPLYMENPK